MNACPIQWIIALVDSHKSRALFKGFRSEFRHFQKLSAIREPSVCFPVSYNIFCDCSGDTGNIGKKRCGCRIQIYTYLIYTGFHHASKRFV